MSVKEGVRVSALLSENVEDQADKKQRMKICILGVRCFSLLYDPTRFSQVRVNRDVKALRLPGLPSIPKPGAHR